MKAAAELAGIRVASLSDIEHARVKPHDITLAKLAKAYGVDVAELLAAEEEVAHPKAEASRSSEMERRRRALEDVPEGSPDPRFWGLDEDRPNPAVEGIPGLGGRRIGVKIEDGLTGDALVTITYESFLEVFRRVRRGELTPEQAVEEVERIGAA
jgi:transcriptional regulator with XRE-family HTH domain